MNTILIKYSEQEMINFITDLLDMESSWYRTTENSYLKIKAESPKGDSHIYNSNIVKKAIFDRLSVPERKHNFELAHKYREKCIQGRGGV